MCVQCALWSTLCCHVVLTERRMSNKMQIFMSASVCSVFAPSAGISIEFAECAVERFHSVVKLVIIIVVVLVVVHRAPDGVMREWRPDCKLQCVFVPNQIILRIFVGTFRFSCQSLCFCNVCVLCAIDFFLFVYLKITRTIATATATTVTASIHEYETHTHTVKFAPTTTTQEVEQTNELKMKSGKRDKIHNSERLCQCTNSQMNCIFFPSPARSSSISLSSPLCELPPTNTSLKAWPRIFIGYVPDMHRSKSSSLSFSFSFVRSHSVQVFYR